MVEARGGRFDVDVIETGATAMERCTGKMLLREVTTSPPGPYSGGDPGTSRMDRDAVQHLCPAYNTRLIKTGEGPEKLP